MKQCSKCQQNKDRSAFSKHAGRKDGLQPNCKECHKLLMTALYQEGYKRIWQHLEQHPCLECGESDPMVLEFDHRNPDEKVADVSQLVSKVSDWDILRKEIDKCDVLCRNCHMRKTYRQFGWRTYYNAG